MEDEEILGEVLSTSDGELAQLINALAKAAKEHDRFISISITMSPNDEQAEPERE